MMRTVLPGDLVALAVHLMALPEAERAERARSLIENAATADCYRKRFGRAHPVLGDGRLAAAVPRMGFAREPFLSEPEYCRCLIVALSALLGHRNDPRRSSRRRGRGER